MSMQLGICTVNLAVVVWTMAMPAQHIMLSQSIRFVYKCIVVLTFKKYINLYVFYVYTHQR